MKSIGISVTPTEIYFVIGLNKEEALLPVKTGKIRVPMALPVSLRLRYVRTMVIDLINIHKVNRAGIRLSDPVSANVSSERIQIEGIMQELLSSSTVEAYFTGTTTLMAHEMHFPVDLTDFVSGKVSPEGLESWENFKKREEREAILACLAGILLA